MIADPGSNSKKPKFGQGLRSNSDGLKLNIRAYVFDLLYGDSNFVLDSEFFIFILVSAVSAYMLAPLVDFAVRVVAYSPLSLVWQKYPFATSGPGLMIGFYIWRRRKNAHRADWPTNDKQDPSNSLIGQRDGPNVALVRKYWGSLSEADRKRLLVVALRNDLELRMTQAVIDLHITQAPKERS